MKHIRLPSLISLVLLASVLAGCVGPVISPPVDLPPPIIVVDTDLKGTANYVPAQFDTDLYPLFVGARWVYRNAATYWNPQIAGSGLLESEVVAIVRGAGVQCYVLRTHYSNGPDELLYLHRTATRVGLRDAAVISAPGAQPSFSLDPALAFLEFPFAEDKTWDMSTINGVGTATVYHPEVAAIEAGTVNTLLGSLPAIFPGSWRVHFELPEFGPRFYGGPVQFLWFAEGIGVVKHVLNSVDYELAEVRLRDEVLSLTEDSSGSPYSIPMGSVVVVALRAPMEGWRWELVNELRSGSALASIGDYLYPDAPSAKSDAGTHAFQFRAENRGEMTLRFDAGDRQVDFTINVE